MTATRILMLALLAGVVGRWANNEKATLGGGKAVVEAAFVLVVVSAMDQGRTEPIAKGIAWLVLGAVLLGNHSPLSGLMHATSSPPQTGSAANPTQMTAGTPAGTGTTIQNVR